jgi:DNA-binding MarR family transcriptional regulator
MHRGRALYPGAISARGQLRPQDIHDTIGSGSGNITETVDSLEAVGYLIRFPKQS